MTKSTIQSQFNNIVVSNYTSLRNVSNVENNDLIHLLGGIAPNDGDQGSFYWSSTSTAADDGVDIIKPTDITGAGRWLRLGGAASFNLTYGSFTAARALEPPDFDDGTIYVLGKSARNDGGQGLFYYDLTATLADDDYFTLIPDSITFPDPGRWLRVRPTEKFAAGVENVAALRLVLTLVDDNTVFILGQTTRDDGGQGRFYWDSTATAADDGYTIVKPTAITGAGRWIRASGGVPAGSTMAWWTDTLPAGYIHTRGQSLVTTDFPRLFAVLGYAYGGSGLAFNVPDTRGEFLRGTANGSANDPDRAARTGGDSVGSTQGWAIQSHLHSAPAVSSSSFDYLLGGQSFSGPSRVTGLADGGIGGTTGTEVLSISTSVTIGSTGGNQTTPTNINTNWIIKT